ncbi:MAG: hypothetical protein WA876_11165 [Candidatus Acidiferrales bacterium]
MRADRVEVSWDSQKSQWLVRIVNGEEVLRRHVKLSSNADEEALRAAAQKTVADEGYEVDGTEISIHRAQAAS